MPKRGSVEHCAHVDCMKRTDQPRFGIPRALTSPLVQRHSQRLKTSVGVLCDQHWRSLLRLTDDRPRALVLGMAFVTDVFARSAAHHTKQGTSNAYTRDRARLLCLARYYNILTMTSSAAEADCEEGQHCCAHWTRRGAVSLCDRFSSAFSPVHYVFMDYIRFPSQYMRSAYGDVFRQVLPTLRMRGMVTAETIIIVPYLDDAFLDPLRSARLLLPITAETNPLFVATAETSQEDLGDFTNEGEVRQLHALTPFVSVLSH